MIFSNWHLLDFCMNHRWIVFFIGMFPFKWRQWWKWWSTVFSCFWCEYYTSAHKAENMNRCCVITPHKHNMAAFPSQTPTRVHRHKNTHHCGTTPPTQTSVTILNISQLSSALTDDASCKWTKTDGCRFRHTSNTSSITDHFLLLDLLWTSTVGPGARWPHPARLNGTRPAQWGGKHMFIFININSIWGADCAISLTQTWR